MRKCLCVLQRLCLIWYEETTVMKTTRQKNANEPTVVDPTQRLIELQALAQMQIAKTDERMARADERMARVEQRMDERMARVDEQAAERMARIDERMARADERMARADERFNQLAQETKESVQRLERAFASAIRMLEALPDAVREKIGFAAAPS